MRHARRLAMLFAGAGLALAAPALAGVKEGVDAWTRGDFAGAIREWQGPAAAGDADAQFNLAQAYKLGRGVLSKVGESVYKTLMTEMSLKPRPVI